MRDKLVKLVYVTAIMMNFSISFKTQAELVSCVLTPNADVNVASAVPGVIETIPVERGQQVTKGQMLFKLSDKQQRAVEMRTSTQHQFFERKIERNEQLANQSLLSPHQLDEIATERDIARLDNMEAQALVALRTTLSPLNGFVLERMVDAGEYVGENPVLRVISIDPLYAELTFGADQFGQMKLDQTITLQLTQEFGKVSGKVISVDPIIDVGSSTFRVRLEIANRQEKIPAGLKCALSNE